MITLRQAAKVLCGLVVGVTALDAAVSQAAASTFITTVTYTGKISTGGEFDSLNILFPYYYGTDGTGCSATCVNGTPYTLAFTFESPPGTLTNGDLIIGGGSAVLTVKGVQFTFTGLVNSEDTIGINGGRPNFNYSQVVTQVYGHRSANQGVGSANMLAMA